ncbi:polyphosphate kinase 1 [Conexibacter sp. JD483]|uniref:polyphosphate kinase 1 n=1 Tax=unclassified Conexibacter TaxID=2627773 RepID=UPI002716DD21|nr:MULTISPECIES: polyphosphate kinase 1 [unclassified Conexibacter]MDO8186189.1 polyphosphate kinase 1 [Conexibacter sp. CPCC 205706]MDO8199744.1 polyphosphate kinase 1 [Conexibacter sp. CPCC 205762]MDR9368164.1 polyphosphate kinase 1 [Conexibacter sp. JD483]
MSSTAGPAPSTPSELPAFARGSDTIANAWTLALETYRAKDEGNVAADVEHVAITARLLHDAGADDATVATAVLHDLIEDTGVDRSLIAEQMGEEIARRVDALTERPEISSYNERKAELRQRGIDAGRDVAAVMAADKLARATRAAGGRLRPEKLRHYQATLSQLRDAFPDLPLLPALGDAVERLKPADPAKTVETADPAHFINRELSWLDFNERVLQLAEDSHQPLMERVKFSAIYGSNLDEWFMVRVAGVAQKVDAGIEATSADGMPPTELLEAIGTRVRALATRQAALFDQTLLPALAEHGVRIVAWDQLDDAERQEVDARFEREVFPALTPLAVGPAQPFPYISNLSLSLAVLVRDPESEQTRFARVKVPKEGLPRFLQIGAGARTLVPMETVIAAHLDQLFRGMEIVTHGLFRVTRDADFTVSDEADDLLEAVEAELRRRRFGEVVRLEVSEGIDPILRARLLAELRIEEGDVYDLGGMLDYADLWQVAKLPGFRDLRDAPWTPVMPPEFVEEGKQKSLFSQIRERDLLVHHPYDSFATVEQFVKQAVADPKVLAIKQTVYRTSDDSPLVPALIRAAERGKQAVGLVELKARFDERQNIMWARALEQAGVHVTFGMPGLKTHAKAVLVVRREGNGVKHYAHVGTGNYHAGTAHLYTDFGLFTADDEITAEIAELFNQLTGYSKPDDYEHVLVAPLNLRDGIIEQIDATIAAHTPQQPARIAMKMNSLVDPACIRALYRASQAGVQVELNVRGACCLRPGVSGVSENIRVVSIVGRFLEHSRIYAFERGGETTVLMGSADLMPRNLDARVELVVPVRDADARAEVLDALERCLADTENAWELRADGSWHHRRVQPGEERHDVQAELMRLHRARAEHVEA